MEQLNFYGLSKIPFLIYGPLQLRDLPDRLHRGELDQVLAPLVFSSLPFSAETRRQIAAL